MFKFKQIEPTAQNKSTIGTELKEELPNSLLTGHVQIGRVISHDTIQAATLPRKTYSALTDLSFFGKDIATYNGYIANYCKNISQKREPIIVVDYGLENSTSKGMCMTDHLKATLPNLNIKIFDFGSAYLPHMDFNVGESITPETLDFKTKLTIALIASMKGYKLSPRMCNYIASACTLVYMQPNTSVVDVIQCITHPNARQIFIDTIPAIYKSNRQWHSRIDDALYYLEKLNQFDEKGNLSSTVGYKVDFLTSRMRFLRNDTRLSGMLYNSHKPLELKQLCQDYDMIIFKVHEADEDTLTFLNTFLLCKLQEFVYDRMESNLIFPHAHIVLRPEKLPTSCEDTLRELINKYRKQSQISFLFCAEHQESVAKYYSSDDYLGISRIFTKQARLGDVLAMNDMLLPYTVEDFINLQSNEALAFIRSEIDEITPFVCRLASMQINTA